MQKEKSKGIIQSNPLLKPRPAAAYLGRSYAWLKAHGDELKIPYVRYGGRAKVCKLYRQSDLDAFIEKHLKGIVA